MRNCYSFTSGDDTTKNKFNKKQAGDDKAGSYRFKV